MAAGKGKGAAVLARSMSGIAYPARFYAAAASAGLGAGAAASRFDSDTALLLYGLYQQATVGQCMVPKPSAWKPVELSKWTSWHGLGNMASAEAMRLFVKILEEEDSGWHSRASDLTAAPSIEVPVDNLKAEPTIKSASPNGIPLEEPKVVLEENGKILEIQDKEVTMEGLCSISTYDQWTALSVSGQPPKPRYKHGAAMVQEKMYVFGGNHNGRYLNDIQVLDFKNLTWSKLEATLQAGPSESAAVVSVTPCAGHSLIPWGDKILSLAGHTRDPMEALTVKEFDPQTCTFSNLRTYGSPPSSRGGQSVTLVGDTLVVFGGEGDGRSLLNDLHILDLETMTWDEIDAIGTPPSPRSEHAAACYAERYLLIFGGGSHSTCFDDLHLLDLQTMEWSRPEQQGVTPEPRAGHAGVTIGDHWFIIGGGNNKKGVSETLVLNMSNFVWSVVTSLQGRAPPASEGSSLVVSTINGEDFLVSFGGYNGRYSNEVYALRTSLRSHGPSREIKRLEPNGAASASAAANPRREVVFEIEELGEEKNSSSGEIGRTILAALRAEKDQVEVRLNNEQLQTLQLKQELADIVSRNAELTKELHSVRDQLTAEEARSSKLENEVAELQQRLGKMGALEEELEVHLQQQRNDASEQAALSSNQRRGSGSMWGWSA